MRGVFAAVVSFCLSLVIAAAGSTAAFATPQSLPALSLKELTADVAPATKANYRHYCVRQYFKCRDRWEEGWRFRRCMKWRGCWEAYLDYRERRNDDHYGGCSRWRDSCAENWGYGNSDYYGCLRYHGCD